MSAPAVQERGGPASPARERILVTADRLFYGTGIRAVGVERVITEAGVARMTFFRHFPSKDDLVVAFLARRVGTAQEALARVRAEHPGEPRRVLEHFAAQVSDEAGVAEFRGCEFVNTAAEFYDSTHPVRRVVADHRAWITERLAEALTGLGHPAPRRTAELLLMLRTGFIVASSLEGLTSGDAEFERAWWLLVGDPPDGDAGTSCEPAQAGENSAGG
ncbi:TetR/AcrR family transcriptional regulator [Microlunatus flavus]|uniref:TetR/AcrR family transcriptional regulator n=1 Tax=Microlunatus flavus TaxID=1036181 RepID=UPI0014807E72|nr:TetR/AcrR family transcriptional regulator [Microlunatus flavus]